MVRAVVGVIVGYAIWTVLWLGGNAVFFRELGSVTAEGEASLEPGFYIGVLGLSVVCSIMAGITGAATAGSKARGSVLVMSLLLLVTGIGVQIGAWDLMPTWYHLTFLALIVPVCIGAGLFSARFGASKRDS